MTSPDRFQRKIDRASKRLGQPCQFIPSQGKPFERSINLLETGRDTSLEYVVAPIQAAEFIRSEGCVAADDIFVLHNKTYRLNELHTQDEYSVSFVYIEL